MIATGILYAVARAEVMWARVTRRIDPNLRSSDLLPPMMIPSIAQGNSGDRDLAEIDQDGFAFAVDERDARFFYARAKMVPRRHHRLQIILSGGVVCVRKQSVPTSRGRFLDRFRDLLRWDFYVEAAALLRLRGLPFVPTIRRIDCGEGVIEMDYIWGRDLRHILAESRNGLDYGQVSSDFLVLVNSDDPAAREMGRIILATLKRGVIPRDVNASNFIRGWRSGSLYIIDFDLAYFSAVPGWRKHADHLSRLLKDHST